MWSSPSSRFLQFKHYRHSSSREATTASLRTTPASFHHPIQLMKLVCGIRLGVRVKEGPGRGVSGWSGPRGSCSRTWWRSWLLAATPICSSGSNWLPKRAWISGREGWSLSLSSGWLHGGPRFKVGLPPLGDRRFLKAGAYLTLRKLAMAFQDQS